AIGALAAILLITIQHQISEIITGLAGVLLIAASFLSSIRRNNVAPAEEDTNSARAARLPVAPR
ncbi:DUF475 domain-containing protein, partial [Streptomyces sp. HUCO-GS316]|uniref:DUF475 domain-containing protein n=1 Tax=Streptomyces sp. HUCO-GS316 TaxID=2692198 RepID=UPI00136F8043